MRSGRTSPPQRPSLNRPHAVRQPTFPTLDITAVRAALVDLPGIDQVILTTNRSGAEMFWVVLGTRDYDRDERIIAALTALDLFDVQLTPAEARGMIPHGVPAPRCRVHLV